MLIDYNIIFNQDNLNLAIHHLNYKRPDVTYAVFCLTILKLIYEGGQMTIQGVRSYFQDLTNVYDFLGLSCVIAYTSMKFMYQPVDEREY